VLLLQLVSALLSLVCAEVLLLCSCAATTAVLESVLLWLLFSLVSWCYIVDHRIARVVALLPCCCAAALLLRLCCLVVALVLSAAAAAAAAAAALGHRASVPALGCCCCCIAGNGAAVCCCGRFAFVFWAIERCVRCA
jgi:hypothetical protein